jgi:hypothetical protein
VLGSITLTTWRNISLAAACMSSFDSSQEETRTRFEDIDFLRTTQKKSWDCSRRKLACVGPAVRAPRMGLCLWVFLMVLCTSAFANSVIQDPTSFGYSQNIEVMTLSE